MLEYVHSVPGRLRIQGPLFRGKTGMAASARARLAAIDGVSSVTANSCTGSLTIYYDRHVLSCDALWEQLHRAGYVSGIAPAQGSARPEPLGQALVETASRALVSKLAEQSASMLVRALI